MPSNAEQTTVTPAGAADLVGVEVYTIRRWCDWHKVHLSPGASPAAGALRRLIMRDVEVLRAVRDLRAQGLTTTTINEQLENMAFPEVSTDPPINTELAPPASQETQGNAPALIVVVDDLQTQMRALQQAIVEHKQSQRDTLQTFVLGFLTACGLFLILLLLAVLYGGFR
jgi:DNA-binding transcriptional MerR regulator